MMFRNMVFVLAAVVSIVKGADIPKIQSRDNVIAEWQGIAAGKTAITDVVKVQFGTAPVSDFKNGYIELPVNFKETDFERANWDFLVDLDLTRSKGLAFDFYCEKMSAFISFSIYLHADGAWQHGKFSPGKDGRWKHIEVSENVYAPDGGAARSDKFKHVDRIRISGWRGCDVDTTCALANLSLIPFEPEVLLLSGVSSAKDKKDEKQFTGFAHILNASLSQLGLDAIIVDDVDLEESVLEGIKVVALPYSTSLPENVMPLLRGFVERGGKVICFYTLTDELRELMAVKKRDWIKAESGHFAGFSRVAGGLKGQPRFAAQRSWCAWVYTPDPAVEGGRVVARWRDGAGNDTQHPAIVRTAAGVVVGHVWLRDDDPAREQLLISLLGDMVPSIWKNRARGAFEKIGRVEDVGDFSEFSAAVKSKPARGVTASFFKELLAARQLAQKAFDNEDWELCYRLSVKAQELAVKCWCGRYEPVANEHRAFWCHSAFGLGTNNWDQSIRFLKEHGFNAIIPNMLWGDIAYYPSDVLPRYKKLAERGDQMKQCVAACKKYGVECHVWKVCWRARYQGSSAFADKMREEQRLQVSDSGADKKVWLCPSHPLNQRMEIEAMLEVARNYDVDGVHFDYIRYPGSRHCYCDGCRERFRAYLGRDPKEWPRSIEKGGTDHAKWLEFRRQNISKVVREVAVRVRKIRKGVEVSAAVFRNADSDRDSIGQDWRKWCQEGLLDFVCPMNYIDSTSAFENVINLQKRHVADARFYPGIGLSCWKDGSDYAIKLCNQIEAARAAGLKGYTVFNFDRNAEKVLPYLKLGTTRPE